MAGATFNLEPRRHRDRHFARPNVRGARIYRSARWFASCLQFHFSRRSPRSFGRNRFRLDRVEWVELAQSCRRRDHARRDLLQSSDPTPTALHQATQKRADHEWSRRDSFQIDRLAQPRFPRPNSREDHRSRTIRGTFRRRSLDFAGAIAIEGTLNARERKLGGFLTASGNSLSLFKRQIDRFATKINLKADTIEFEQFEVARKKDFIRAQGKI